MIRASSPTWSLSKRSCFSSPVSVHRLREEKSPRISQASCCPNMGKSFSRSWFFPKLRLFLELTWLGLYKNKWPWGKVLLCLKQNKTKTNKNKKQVVQLKPKPAPLGLWVARMGSVIPRPSGPRPIPGLQPMVCNMRFPMFESGMGGAFSPTTPEKTVDGLG